MRITIEIQNVLLNRLTQARGDDGVVDFAECIDLSDQGCMKALTAIQELYQRRLEGTLHKEQPDIQELPKYTERAPVAQRRTEPLVPTQLEHNEPAIKSRQHLEHEQPMPASTSERKKSRGLRGLLQSKSGEDPKPRPVVQPTYQRTQTAPAAVAKPQRRSTMMTVETSPTSHPASRLWVSPQKSSRSDHSSLLRRGTDPQTWTQGMSRASTLQPNALNETVASTSVTETPKIKIYGGSCKYAFQIRENGPKGNLNAQNLAMYTENWVLKCSSSKCKFQRPIRHPKTRDPLIDNTIHTKNGIEFRWLFLAKSHCLQTEVTAAFPFVCLICQLISGDPRQYHGLDQLFEHIAGHREDHVGGVQLEGPLSFSNLGIKMDPEFDLNLPERQRSPQKRPKGKAIQEQDMSYETVDEVDFDRHSKASSMISHQTDDSSLSAQTDPYANPWA